MPERAEVLEREAEARYRAVDHRGAIERYEQAYRAYREDGDALGRTTAASSPPPAGGRRPRPS